MKGKTTVEKPMDNIAVINREAGRLKGLEEMRTERVNSRVAAARADLEPCRLEALRYLRIAEADQQKYGALLEVIKALNLTKNDGGMWAQSVDRAAEELKGSLDRVPNQLQKVLDRIKNLSSRDLQVNYPIEARSVVLGSSGVHSRNLTLIYQIQKGMTYLKNDHPENGARVSLDPNLAVGTTTIMVKDAKSGEEVSMEVSRKSPLKVVDKFNVFERSK